MKETLLAKGQAIVDTYRTVPLGETFILTIFTINILRPEPPSIAAGIIGVVGSLAMIAKQYSLRRRLEHSLEQHGYQDRIFLPTVSTWCDRQTARVVTRQHHYLNRYKKLCQTNQDVFSLSFLPDL